jgi:hypothetical protein
MASRKPRATEAIDDPAYRERGISVHLGED